MTAVVLVTADSVAEGIAVPYDEALAIHQHVPPEGADLAELHHRLADIVGNLRRVPAQIHQIGAIHIHHAVFIAFFKAVSSVIFEKPRLRRHSNRVFQLAVRAELLRRFDQLAHNALPAVIRTGTGGIDILRRNKSPVLRDADVKQMKHGDRSAHRFIDIGKAVVRDISVFKEIADVRL